MTKEYERQVALLVKWLFNNDVGCIDVTLSLSELDNDHYIVFGDKPLKTKFQPKSLAYYQMQVSFTQPCLVPMGLFQ